MHQADADFLGTSAPDDPLASKAPAIWTTSPYQHNSVPRVESKDVQGVWAEAVVDALENIQDAAERAHEETIAADRHMPAGLALLSPCNTCLQGCEDADIARATHILSRHACQRSEILVFCIDQSKAEHVAAKLGATVAPRGGVAGGTALG